MILFQRRPIIEGSNYSAVGVGGHETVSHSQCSWRVSLYRGDLNAT